MTHGDRAMLVHEGIREAYLSRGGDTTRWEQIAGAPHRFNRVWRWVLRLPDATTPPPVDFRAIVPSTGEFLIVDEDRW